MTPFPVRFLLERVEYVDGARERGSRLYEPDGAYAAAPRLLVICPAETAQFHKREAHHLMVVNPGDLADELAIEPRSLDCGLGRGG